jgi:hypothetical protein
MRFSNVKISTGNSVPPIRTTSKVDTIKIVYHGSIPISLKSFDGDHVIIYPGIVDIEHKFLWQLPNSVKVLEDNITPVETSVEQITSADSTSEITE